MSAGSNTRYGPSNITEVYGANPLPNIMNFNFGIQHQLGSTTFDASYVGSLSRHLPLSINLNPIPMFARFQPQNADPTQPASPLPDNLLRPYQGYANVTSYQFMGTANYNSVQVSARRRMSRGLQFGASYTFSKALGDASSDTQAVSAYFSPRAWNYGPLSFDRSQSLVVNYLYDFPNLGANGAVRPVKWILNNWQFSGITSFQTGAPFTPSFSTTNGMDLTGSTEGARINVIGNPYQNIPAGGFFFNPAAFALPAKGTFGNAGIDIMRDPGISNWDLSLTKRFQFSEARSLAFRAEFFNAFNHTQFSGLYAAAQFQPNGTQIDPNFGLPSSARTARNIQLSLRLTF